MCNKCKRPEKYEVYDKEGYMIYSKCPYCKYKTGKAPEFISGIKYETGLIL